MKLCFSTCKFETNFSFLFELLYLYIQYDDVSVDLGLPEIPNDSDDQSGGGNGGGGAAEPDDDFDDLQARFNALKKK